MPETTRRRKHKTNKHKSKRRDDWDMESDASSDAVSSNEDNDAFLKIPQTPNQTPIVLRTEKELKKQNSRAKRRSIFLLRVLLSFILVLNFFLVLFFRIGENNRTVYIYFTVAGAQKSELPLVVMFIVALTTSLVPSVIAFCGVLWKNQILLLVFRGMGKISIAVYCVNFSIWILFLALVLSGCRSNAYSTTNSFYLGEFSWAAQSVALNFVLLKHKTCERSDMFEWHGTVWKELQDQAGELGINSFLDHTDTPRVSIPAYFINFGFKFKRPFPVFCCPAEMNESASVIQRNTLLPHSIDASMLESCYDPEKLYPTSSTTSATTSSTTSQTTSNTTSKTTSATTSNTTSATTTESTSSTAAQRYDSSTASEMFLPDSAFFQSAVNFSDQRDVTGTFFFPKDMPMLLSWRKAKDYCSEGIREMPEMQQKGSLPLGFTTSELVFLSKITKSKNHSESFLGFQRSSWDPLMFSDQEGEFKLTENTNSDHWSSESTGDSRFQGSFKFGCLDMISNARTICQNQKRIFTCALYYRLNQKMPYPDYPAREGVRVFHWTDNKHLAAFFFSVKLRKGFQSAREYCAMNFDGSDLAVGFSDKELKFLAMTSFEEPAFGKRIHLGFRRKGKDPIFWSVTRGVPFGWSWAEKTPVLAEEQRYVCVQPGNVTRTTCNNDERPFICAVYYTKPETIHEFIDTEVLASHKVMSYPKQRTFNGTSGNQLGTNNRVKPDVREASPKRKGRKNKGFFYWMKEAIHQTIGQKKETTAEVVCYKVTTFFLPTFLIMTCTIPLMAVCFHYAEVLVYK